MGVFLVIEDSITIRKLVELAFRGSDVRLEFATSGAEGLTKIRSLGPSVVLMDYVLPDMKGIDICSKVAEGDGPKPFILVMSAKMDQVRPLFAPYPFVIDFVMKPFKGPDIVALVTAAMSRGGAQMTAPPEPAPTAAALPPADREAAAFSLFAQLRPKFAQIPSWMPELENTSPAKFFAKRILTPDVVERMLEGLVPIVRDRVRKSSLLSESVTPDALLEGRLGTLSAHDMLALVQRMERTGELVLGEHSEVLAFFRAGTLILATTKDAARWLEGLDLDLSMVSPEAMRKAEEEQGRTGKPVLVTLAELGTLPRCDLSSLLGAQGKHVLRGALGTLGVGTPFVFRACTLPLYVDAYGRALSFRQVLLERLRSELPEEASSIQPETLFERRSGFSKRLLHFELIPAERRVLALVDGNTAVRMIAQRTGLSFEEVRDVLIRLCAVELLSRRDGTHMASNVPPSLARRQVMILEPDVESFQRPLGRLLAERPGAYDLIALDGEEDLFHAISRDRPALVLLNVAARGKDECARTARAVRAADDLRDVLLVAVLDWPANDEEQSLSEAGFDTVLTKPVSYEDIERMLVA